MPRASAAKTAALSILRTHAAQQQPPKPSAVPLVLVPSRRSAAAQLSAADANAAPQPSRKRAGEAATSGSWEPAAAKRGKSAAKPGSGSSFVPWAVYARERGLDGATGRGPTVHLLTPAADPPPSWFPCVHQLGDERTELAKRGLEAVRLAPALGRRSVCEMLDTPWASLAAWPAPPPPRQSQRAQEHTPPRPIVMRVRHGEQA